MIKTGLIGKKLGHSLSPQIHQRFYDITNTQGSYRLFETPRNKIGTLLETLESDGYTGLNVTIPHKTDVMRWLDHISEKAEAIGAVNTILLKNGERYGYNTDYYGLNTLLESSNISVKSKRVVILGTGGAARCTLKLVQDLEASEIIAVSRNPERSDPVFRAAGYDTLDSLDTIDVLINTTPVGMSPNADACPVGLAVIEKSKAVVDLIYNPWETQLLKHAKSGGKTYANGLLMLSAQAIKAQEIWNDKTYDQRIYQNVFQFLRSIAAPQKTNIVLIGMPGSGKSTIGQRLSQKLGRRFADTDTMVEREHGSIPEIFKGQGEHVFRQYEHEAAVAVAKLENTVISTGGGIILNERNMQALGETGVIVFLDRPLKMLIDDTDTSSRPLLADGKKALTALYEKRYPLYQKYADMIPNNAEDIDTCVFDIIKKLEDFQK